MMAVRSLHFPAPHGEHEVAISRDEYVPMGHAEQPAANDVVPATVP
jgi:hypothetical protein